MLVYTSDDRHNHYDPSDCMCEQCEHDYLYHGMKMDEYCYTCTDVDCPNYDPNASSYDYLDDEE